MDRAFQAFFRPLAPSKGGAPLEGYRMPTADLAETDNEFVLKAELPGVDKKDLEIEVLPEGISLKAETTKEKETKEAAYHQRERIFTSFQRYLVLPAEVKAEEVKASFKDGLLELHLPKAEAAKAKKPVKVTVE